MNKKAKKRNVPSQIYRVFYVQEKGLSTQALPWFEISAPEAGSPREQVKNHGRACTQSFSYVKQRPVAQGNRSKITEGPVLSPFPT